jgi:hypothetical protein
LFVPELKIKHDSRFKKLFLFFIKTRTQGLGCKHNIVAAWVVVVVVVVVVMAMTTLQHVTTTHL